MSSLHYNIATDLIRVPPECKMIEQAGATAIGSNQVTEVVAKSANARGLILLSLYTQVIQVAGPGNVAQSLIMSAESAPTDFADKDNCFPIYRTYQSDRQDLVAQGGLPP